MQTRSIPDETYAASDLAKLAASEPGFTANNTLATIEHGEPDRPGQKLYAVISKRRICPEAQRFRAFSLLRQIFTEISHKNDR